MPPAGKRKRGERGSLDSGDQRPSPHRPSESNLARRDQGEDMRNSRRTSRGRGGGRPRNDRRDSGPLNNPNSVPIPPRAAQTPMSPPPAPRPTDSAQTQPSPASEAAMQITIPEQKPKRVILPYDYTYITDERIAAWATSGRQEVIAVGVQAIHDLDEYDLSTIFQEFLRAVFDDRLDATDVGSCVKEILGPDTSPVDEKSASIDGAKLFLDCVSIMGDQDPLEDGLRNVLSNCGISDLVMRQLLDARLLEFVGLTRSTFSRTGVRYATNLLYRQANHNLLREETEGYSKLVTELFTTSATSSSESSEIAKETFERVKGLIGTFDLDVGRVLDVTLDVFASVLIKQFRFFIKFLRVSSWWPEHSRNYNVLTSGLPRWALPESTDWFPTESDDLEAAQLRQTRDMEFWERARKIGLDAFFELGGRAVICEEERERLVGGQDNEDSELDADRQWIRSTGTLPPSGNRVAAQYLGFKLRFYASPARDNTEWGKLPANLIFLAALLIKIGFVSLRDLYPHLWPADNEMEAIKESKKKELIEKEKLNRHGGGANALMTAGALADDTVPTSSRSLREAAESKTTATTTGSNTNGDQKDDLPEPDEQKVKLLVNLLTIGAIPEALFILAKFPWIPEAFPEVYELLHRIIHHSISAIYEETLASGITESSIPAKKSVDLDQSTAPKGQVRLMDSPPRRALRWPYPDNNDVNEGLRYRFYWDEWADHIPVCRNLDDFFTLCDTFMNLSGPNIGRDSALLSKIACIGTHSLTTDHSQANVERWQALLKRLLVPALSFTKSNTSVVNQIFDMLRFYPAPVRYNIYAEWYEGSISRMPAMAVAFKATRLEALSIMKRISKTNLQVMAKSLAKAAYGSPGIVFKVALDQIEAYSNLTEVVVECARYFTDLGYDVLLWSLMSSLGGQSRTRTRADAALLTSRWLIALSRFSGKIFKRYSNMSPSPILQYVNDQLYQGNSTDLIILEELIAQMSGVVSDTDFTDSQLLAMTGGELLRRQTLINLQDKRFESTKTAKRFMRSLTETKLAGQLLISIAQHRQSAAFDIPEEDAHIKYLATVTDETQRILLQYLDLLRSNLTVEEFDELVPNTAELMAEYNLEPSLAFLIGRASFARRLTAVQGLSTKTNGNTPPPVNGTTAVVDAEGDAAMANGEVSEVVENNGITDNAQSSDSPAAAIESPSPVIVSPPAEVIDLWRNALAPLIDAVRQTLPASTWDLLNPEFHALFWQLSMSDINLPMDSYTAETARLGKEIQDIIRDRSDTSTYGVQKKDQARKALETMSSNLLKESKQEMNKYGQSRARLNKEKHTWFTNLKGKPDAVSDALWEECFMPRILLSPIDADYTFRMIKFLHNNNTPRFRTLGLYARFFRANRLRSQIFACTIREAENLGRFMKLLLGDLARWHNDKKLYEKEAVGINRDLHGFAKKILDDGKAEASLDYEDFRRILFNWHKQLNSALKSCLGGMEWMHIRNAITILKSVVEHFPAIDFMGKSFQATLTDIGKREFEKRDDLSLTANALLPELKKRQGKWIMMQAFATGIAGANGDSSSLTNGNQANNAKSATPQPDTKTALKPTAPEFKPQSRISSDSKQTKPSSNDVEDGEVADAKERAARASKFAATALVDKIPDSTAAVTSVQSAQTPTTGSSGSDRREHSSRVSTPQPSGQRVASTNSFRDKPTTALPSRPDGPVPPQSELDRHRTRLGDGRDSRDGHSPRSDRPTPDPRDRFRDQVRELSSTHRGGPDLIRDSGHPHDRHGPGDRDRRDGGRALDGPRDLPRDINRDNGNLRERPTSNGSRGPETNGRRDDSRSNQTPFDRSLPPQGRLPLSNPAVENINADRASLISKTIDPIQAGPPGGRDPPSRIHSRPQSPRGDRLGSNRDSDSGRMEQPPFQTRGPDTRPTFIHGRRDDSGPAPSGPRGDRMIHDGLAPNRTREGFMNHQAPRIPDPDHGRLNQPGRGQPDPNYGRLTTEKFGQDAPSGPRDRNIRSSSNITAPPPPVDPRSNMQDQSSPASIPTGPAAGRHSRVASTSIPAPNNSGFVPQIPGVHPDRAAIIPQPSTPYAAPLPHPQQPTTPGLHPDRAKAMQHTMQQPLPHIQTSNSRGASNIPSPLSSGPPSGPRGAQSNVNPGPSPTTNTPTGPSGNDRNRGAHNERRKFAGLGGILSQAGTAAPSSTDRSMSIKGRGVRGSLGGADSLPTSAPHTPSTSTISLPGKQESIPDNKGDLINPARLSAIQDANTSGRGDDYETRNASARGRHGESRDPSSRHGDGRRSHRSSRSKSPTHGREREHREHRDRPPRSDENERGREGREDGGRDQRGGGGNSMRGNDSRGNDGHRDRRSGAGHSNTGSNAIPGGPPMGRDLTNNLSGHQGLNQNMREREHDGGSGRHNARGNEKSRDGPQGRDEPNWAGHGPGPNSEFASGGGGSGRNSGRELRGGDDRRDGRDKGDRERGSGRGRDDSSSRKRHSEEGVEARGHDKRPRR